MIIPAAVGFQFTTPAVFHTPTAAHRTGMNLLRIRTRIGAVTRIMTATRTATAAAGLEIAAVVGTAVVEVMAAVVVGEIDFYVVGQTRKNFCGRDVLTPYGAFQL